MRVGCRSGEALALLLVVAGLATSAWAAGPAKVEVCHIPPGNPAGYHTITISETALAAHLAHGDLEGGCYEHCETLCDDGDACTIDACDPGTEVCAAEHPPVNCDDGLYCTTDSCDPQAGSCVYVPVTCDAPDLCTVSTCSEYDQGACVDVPKSCPPGEECVLETGLCENPCSGVVCEPPAQCQVGSCWLGECWYENAPDGTACDDGDPHTGDDLCTAGVCTGTPLFGCAGGWRYEDQGDGTVLDCNTGLVWLKDASCAELGTEWSPGYEALGDWWTAQSEAASLGDGKCGLTDGSAPGDWRVPTIWEFCSRGGTRFEICPPESAPDSLIDSSLTTGIARVVNARGNGHWAEGNAFIGVKNYVYWTSTEWQPSPEGYAWLAYLDDGLVQWDNKAFPQAIIWAVRRPE